MNIITIYKQFPTDSDCIAHLEKVRWPGGARCPYCGSEKATRMPKENRYHCFNCKTSYSVTVNTIFHDTKLDLQKWFLAISLILNAKKGISSRQLARDLQVNKNTAWYMAMRIRKAMVEHGELLKGIVEVDECYIGGKPRKGNDKGPSGSKLGRGTDKIPVVGAVERGGKVTAKVARNLKAKPLSSFVKGKIQVAGTTVMTDEFSGYCRLKYFVNHETINHQEAYVCGNIHTKGIESFWAILKRGMIGQFHKVSARHLGKYVDEFCYRYNHRKNLEVFALTLSRTVGAGT